jgi:hypothetical protein
MIPQGTDEVWRRKEEENKSGEEIYTPRFAAL